MEHKFLQLTFPRLGILYDKLPKHMPGQIRKFKIFTGSSTTDILERFLKEILKLAIAAHQHGLHAILTNKEVWMSAGEIVQTKCKSVLTCNHQRIENYKWRQLIIAHESSRV